MYFSSGEEAGTTLPRSHCVSIKVGHPHICASCHYPCVAPSTSKKYGRDVGIFRFPRLSRRLSLVRFGDLEVRRVSEETFCRGEICSELI